MASVYLPLGHGLCSAIMEGGLRLSQLNAVKHIVRIKLPAPDSITTTRGSSAIFSCHLMIPVQMDSIWIKARLANWLKQ